jgi:hypothetical protein
MIFYAAHMKEEPSQSGGERDNLEDRNICGKIMLHCVLQKLDEFIRIRFSCLKIGCSGRQ